MYITYIIQMQHVMATYYLHADSSPIIQKNTNTICTIVTATDLKFTVLVLQFPF